MIRSRQALLLAIAIIAVLAVLAAAPFYLSAYGTGLLLGITSYVTLATAWAMFSGPTRYVSLATVAFFGIGAYTVAVLNETLPYPVIVLIAGLIGLAVAVVVGLSTLRLAGVYFVIFTFGLAELVRQVVTWYQSTIAGELGLYVFLPIEPRHIYWQLLALASITIFLSWRIGRGRIGLALRAIGDDEVVAQHAGINLPRVKLLLFSLSATIMTLVGAVQAPRWVYLEPAIVFNPTISFLTLIMALLGGATRLWGPLLGTVPLFLIFEYLSAHFPNHHSIILGLLFIVIVFLLPQGVLARLEDLRRRATRSKSK